MMRKGVVEMDTGTMYVDGVARRCSLTSVTSPMYSASTSTVYDTLVDCLAALKSGRNPNGADVLYGLTSMPVWVVQRKYP